MAMLVITRGYRHKTLMFDGRQVTYEPWSWTRANRHFLAITKRWSTVSWLEPGDDKSHLERYFWIHYWLVVDLPLWKIWKSVRIIIPNIWEKMFQTTNQPWFFAFTIQFRGKFWEIVFVFHLSLGLPTFADTQDNHFVPSPSHLRAPQSVDPFVGAPSSWRFLLGEEFLQE